MTTIKQIMLALNLIIFVTHPAQSSPEGDEVSTTPESKTDLDGSTTFTIVPTFTRELSTEKRIDVTQHRNIQLLPTLPECGITEKDYVASNGKLGVRTFPARPTVSIKYPWIVRLVIEDSKRVRSMGCTGTLITSRYVLTTATCMAGLASGCKVSNVILGGHGTNCDKGYCSSSSKMVDVQETVVHPDFVLPTRENDIGIIRLSRDVLSEYYVRPVCLPQSEDLLAFWKTNKTTVVGWTKSDESTLKLFPSNLESLTMSLEPRDYCDRFYKRSHAKFGPGRYCASGGADKVICTEDHGAPAMKLVHLLDLRQDRIFQFGIASFQHKLCGLPGIPNGFINVINYMPWILDNLYVE